MKTFFYVEFIVDLFSVPLSYFLLQLKEKNHSEKEREKKRQFLWVHVNVPDLHPPWSRLLVA